MLKMKNNVNIKIGNLIQKYINDGTIDISIFNDIDDSKLKRYLSGLSLIPVSILHKSIEYSNQNFMNDLIKIYEEYKVMVYEIKMSLDYNDELCYKLLINNKYLLLCFNDRSGYSIEDLTDKKKYFLDDDYVFKLKDDINEEGLFNCDDEYIKANILFWIEYYHNNDIISKISQELGTLHEKYEKDKKDLYKNLI
jgi:hypothetical protein